MKKRNPRTKLIALVITMIAVIIMIASAAGKGQQASQLKILVTRRNEDRFHE